MLHFFATLVSNMTSKPSSSDEPLEPPAKPSVKFLSVTVAFVVLFLLCNIPFLTAVSNNKNRDDSKIYPTFHPDQIPTLSANKTFIVTGANSGIGLSTVKILAKAGTSKLIIMACRNMVKCKNARDSIISELHQHEHGESIDVCNDNECAAGHSMKTRIVALHLDLSSLSSVTSFSSEVQEVLTDLTGNGDTPPPLDVLINNAGIMGTQETLVVDEGKGNNPMDPHLKVNHVGHFALTSLLLPNLEKSDLGGRVVSVSSATAAFGPYVLRFDDLSLKNQNFIFRSGLVRSFATYSASKAANLLFARGLHKRYAPKNDKNNSSRGTIVSVSAHPGYSRTNIVTTGWKFLPPFFGNFMKWNKIASMHPDDGAMPQIRAALDVHGVKSDEYVGPMFWTTGKPIVLGTNLWSMHHLFGSLRDEDVDVLWEISENATGLSFDRSGQE